MDYHESIKVMSGIAKSIIKFEKECDSSMRGVYLDDVVTRYVLEQVPEIVLMYEYIVANQKEDYDNYGDIDTSVTKIKVKGKPEYRKENYDCTVTGIELRDIFSDNSFVIIKVIEQHKTLENFKHIYYHVRKVFKEIKEINYKDFARYGDLRDENYVLSINSKYHNEFEFDVESGRGMLDVYREYKQFVDALIQPYLELKDKETEE